MNRYTIEESLTNTYIYILRDTSRKNEYGEYYTMCTCYTREDAERIGRALNACESVALVVRDTLNEVLG